jgi:asparagine synthase (glutamine-hydrolysing)
MCGLVAAIGTSETRDLGILERALKELAHRGPDDIGVEATGFGALLGHTRLAIMDPTRGHQPITDGKDTFVIHNGEIYNYKKLYHTLDPKLIPKTSSDSEVILHLYKKFGEKCVAMLDGDFAFVVTQKEEVLIARDPVGVKPLFYGLDSKGAMWVASEYKALTEACVEIKEFPPGHYFTLKLGFVKYYEPKWKSVLPTGDSKELKKTLIAAVKKRLMSDVPLGSLLSGGLDSSLVSSIAAKELKKEGKILKTFSVGISQDSSDLEKARTVARFIGSEHHEILFTPEEGIKLLPELIYKLESYDVTSIRASTPMYIMSKYISNLGVKVVLSGEGADEVFGGYLYFAHAPSPEDFHFECVRRINRLHTSDVLRADRATMGAAVEARVPFLDQDFLDIAMEIDPKFKMIIPGRRIEKTVLRDAFCDLYSPYLPDDILYRQKEQFSDGVGYSWIDTLKAYTEAQVSDADFAKREELFPHNTPATKEAFYYRAIYAARFEHKDCAHLVLKWIPKWQDYNTDPSGRANKMHQKSL